MNLLFIHERFGAFAGAEVNALATATELRERGHQVALLHGLSTGNGEEAWRATFQPRFPLPHKKPLQILERAIQSFRPDLVYIHKSSNLELLQGLLQTKIPVVRMVHDHELYCMRGYKYNMLNRVVCKRPLSPYCIFPCGACVRRTHRGFLPVEWVSYFSKRKELRLNRRFHRLIVATEYMRQELLRNGFNQNQIEIHAPVPAHPRQVCPSQFSNRNLILYVGQVTRGKGVDLLLRALAKLQAPFECLILGEGHHRPYCEQLSRELGLENRVSFTGFLPQEQLDAYYQQASVLAMSSVWPEPFGAVGLEGMRYGLPVVAFDAGGISEWLLNGHNGFLIPWMDIDAYARQLQVLLQNKALARRMGENGRALLSRQFEFNRYITNLERTFERVVSENLALAP